MRVVCGVQAGGCAGGHSGAWEQDGQVRLGEGLAGIVAERREGQIVNEYRRWLPIVAAARLSENIPELEQWLTKKAMTMTL